MIALKWEYLHRLRFLTPLGYRTSTTPPAHFHLNVVLSVRMSLGFLKSCAEITVLGVTCLDFDLNAENLGFICDCVGLKI
jgi:hypothetical protein